MTPSVTSSSTSAIARASTRLFAGTRARSSSSSTLRRSRHTTGLRPIPQTDFTVNANGTLNLLQATRSHAPDATFVVHARRTRSTATCRTRLPLVELETRLELPADHRWHEGIDTTMSIDHSTHSLFGVSKAAADLLVQEYGRYFDMPTVCFRGGCLTGPQHAGASCTASSPI